MKITEAKYTRRFTTGQYEFEEHTLSCSAGEDENPKGSDLLLELKHEVMQAFAGESIPDKVEKKERKKNGKSNNTKNSDEDGKDPGEQNPGDDVKSDKDNEASGDEASDDNNSNSEPDESPKSEESSVGKEDSGKKAKSSKKSSGDEEKPKKTFKRVPQTYDRSIEQHKDIFGRAYTAIVPNWRESEASKKKAKQISENLEGEPFLDENGEVIDSFKARIRKFLK